MISNGDPLTLTIERPREGAVVLRLVGYCDHETVDGLRRAVSTELPEAACLTVDMAGVGVCDSSGLSALIFARRRAEEAGACLHLTGVGERLRALLRLTGLEELFAEALGASPGKDTPDGGGDQLLAAGGGEDVGQREPFDD
jgi:anti-sigma B factor antagonist